ncbi:MAG: hypothetical protein R2766_06965 [Saprospiraceae bacterium]
MFVDLVVPHAHVGDYTIVLTAEGRKSMSFIILCSKDKIVDQYVGFDASV